MACVIKLAWIVFVLMLVSNIHQCVVGAPQVPCYFIFGDALADNGNNNNLLTLAKVNYPPYGIDFPNGIPTGRFTNGKTQFDILAGLLGFNDSMPPFAKFGTSDILKGVNYASGAAGIRDETGINVGNRISFNGQLVNHQVVVNRITANLGSRLSTSDYLGQCLYTVNIGSDDYLNNYFMREKYPTSRLYTPERYAQVLIDQYSLQLRILYNLGARKIALFGVGALGCLPSSIASETTNGTGCVERYNSAVQLFNDRLRSLVGQLNGNLANAKFTFVNYYEISQTLPSFRVSNSTCCRVSNITGLCLRNSNPCQNRREYVYWDAFHPTEAVNRITAQRAYTAARPTDAFPYDISRLVRL